MADLSKAREIVASMSEADRKTFVEKYNSLDESKKEIVIDRLLSTQSESASVSEETKPSTRQAIVPEPSSIPRRSLAQDIIGVATGLSGGLVQNIGETTAKTVYGEDINIPRGSRLGQTVGAFAPAGVGFKAANIAQKIIKGSGGFVRSGAALAGSGAVGGALFPEEELKERIRNSKIGLVTAPLIGAAIKGTGMAAKPIVKVYKELMDPRIPKIKEVSRQISDLEKELAETTAAKQLQASFSGKTEEEAKRMIKERAGVLIEQAKSFASKAEKSSNVSIGNIRRSIEKSINGLEKQLDVEVDVAAKSYQDKITSFFRRNSESYGDELEKVSDEVAKSGRLTRGEALDVLYRTLKKSTEEAEVDTGSIFSQIQNLIKSKYAEKSVDEATQTITIRNLGDQIPFKEFLQDIRGITNSVKAYKGTSRFSSEEIPAAILQSEFGELVSRLPGGESFKLLQSSYRPVISYMNKANSIIKPYRGEAYKEQAYNLIKKYSEGNATKPERDIVEFIEKGTSKFGTGVGNVSAKSRQIADNIKTLRESFDNLKLNEESRLFKIGEEAAMRISKIKATSEGAQKYAENQVRLAQGKIIQEAAKIEMELGKKISSLKLTERELEDLALKSSERKKIVSGLGLALSGVGGLYAVYRFVSGAERLSDIAGRQ